MASLKNRLEILEEGRRVRAAAELRERLRTVPDEEIARWVFEFRRSATCDCVPDALDDEELWEWAVYGSGGRGVVPEEEVERRLSFICEDVLGHRRHAINAHIKRLKKGANH